MRRLFITILLVIAGFSVFAQTKAPFEVTLKTLEIPGFTGLQSYAWAQYGNKILLVGGRTDGLHQKQPFAAFRAEYNNTNLLVLDLVEKRIWSKSIKHLPPALADQLQSTNMQFIQNDSLLICTGGYGYSDVLKTHRTHPYITVIQVPGIIKAVMENADIEPFLQQLPDERMAVTGGRLGMLDDTFYLVGGQRFDGRYNPHGPDHGPGFTQQYTNEVRRFKISDRDQPLAITDYNAIYDSLKLHRRDYNLLPQRNASGQLMLTVFSGVFQYDADLPYTTLVDVTGNGVQEIEHFNQQFSHYHTASLSIWQKSSSTSYALFFGGIAQKFRNQNGKITKDDEVPFVKSISLVERSMQGITEYLLHSEMPGYLGASAEFVPFTQIQLDQGMVIAEQFSATPILAGYIIGGIKSDSPNIFWPNTQGMSTASPVIFEVWLNKTP